MYKLTYKKRIWIVRQMLKGVSTKDVAQAQKISLSMARRILKTYQAYGLHGLKDHKTGRPETSLNPKAEELIFDQRRYGYGACRIEDILRTKGFNISHRQIEKLLLRNGLVEPNIKKQKPRKWVRYELPNPNDLWHTNWTYDPFTQLNLGVFIDDRTRLITSARLFRQTTSENAISLLQQGIDCFGKPKAVMTDHGSSYYSNKASPNQQNTRFRIALDALGIKHWVARVNRPQTNGKVERFFLTYKTEYATGCFANVHDFIKHYNEVRLHMSLNMRTPKEVWDELVS
jgi:putative transposase